MLQKMVLFSFFNVSLIVARFLKPNWVRFRSYFEMLAPSDDGWRNDIQSIFDNSNLTGQGKLFEISNSLSYQIDLKC